MTLSLITLINRFPNERWNWEGLSMNPNVSLKDMLDNDLPWEWIHVSKNPSVTFDDIKNNPTIFWNWKQISRNYTFQEALERRNKPWNWDVVTYNSITFQDVKNHPKMT